MGYCVHRRKRARNLMRPVGREGTERKKGEEGGGGE